MAGHGAHAPERAESQMRVGEDMISNESGVRGKLGARFDEQGEETWSR